MSYVVVARWQPREGETEKIQCILPRVGRSGLPGAGKLTIHGASWLRQH
jgi:hypothetical protein